MNNKKKYKTTAILYLISCICFFLSGLIQIFNNQAALIIMNFSLTISFGCLSIYYYKKYKKEQ